MTLMKSILLGSAAGIVAVAGAQAADLPTKKAAPAEYVKICNVGGMAGFVIPGSDTCLKIGGYITAHFSAGKKGQQIKPRLRKMINFTQMNLASAVYLGRMDVIFCMNVLIYFSEQRRRSLVQHFYDTLEPGGYLFLGHSESISKMPVKFQAIVLNDCILYRKPTVEELQKSDTPAEGCP